MKFGQPWGGNVYLPRKGRRGRTFEHAHQTSGKDRSSTVSVMSEYEGVRRGEKCATQPRLNPSGHPVLGPAVKSGGKLERDCPQVYAKSARLHRRTTSSKETKGHLSRVF